MFILSFIPLFFVPSHSERKGKQYAEAISIHNVALPEAIQKVSGMVGGAEFCITMAQRFLLCGAYSYPEYPVQDRHYRI